MRKLLFLLCCFFIVFVGAFAQDAEVPQETPSASEPEVMEFKPIRSGDKYIKLGIGLGDFYRDAFLRNERAFARWRHQL